MGVFKNSNFFVSVRKHRAENRNVSRIHEDLLNTSMYLALRASIKLSKICSCNFVSTDDCMDAGGRTTPGAVVKLTPQSQKSAFLGMSR